MHPPENYRKQYSYLIKKAKELKFFKFSQPMQIYIVRCFTNMSLFRMLNVYIFVIFGNNKLLATKLVEMRHGP